MTYCQIYAAASGRCLTGDGTVDETEQSQIDRDFYGGVRFVVDAARDEIRGFIPATRRVDEAFFAVVDITASTTPLETYRDAVESAFEKQPQWSIRYDTPEGRLLQALDKSTAIADVDREHQLEANNPVQDVLVDSSAGDPNQFGVADGAVAGRLLREAYRDGCVNKTSVVAHSDVEHISYDVLYLLREQDTDIIDLTTMTSLDGGGSDDSYGFSEWLSSFFPPWLAVW